MPASRDSNLGTVPDGVHRHGDTGTDFPPRYDGPKLLSQALTQLTRGDEAFTRDGPRADVEYRDLGWAAATGGAIGVKHIRAIRPFAAETGWHWHDMTAHFVYVLQGMADVSLRGRRRRGDSRRWLGAVAARGRRAQRRRALGRPRGARDQRARRITARGRSVDGSGAGVREWLGRDAAARPPAADRSRALGAWLRKRGGALARVRRAVRLLWEFAVRCLGIKEYLLPPPSKVWTEFCKRYRRS